SNYSGDIIKDSLEAPDEAAVVAHVQAQGLIPVKIKKSAKLSLASKSNRGAKVKSSILSIFTMELATLLEAGLPLDRSLNILIGMEESADWRLVLEDLLVQIKSGKNLSEGMRKHPKIFSNFYVGLVHAGELSGALNTVLERLADYLERRAETRRSIIFALIYPVIVIVIGFAILLYLLVGVVPTFAEIVQRNKVDAPLLSDIVFAMSSGLIHYWYVALALLVLLMIWVKIQLRPSHREKLDAKLLKTPLFGDLIRKTELAKLSRTLGTMLSNGVPLATALRSVHESVGNQVLGQTIESATQSLKGGRGMAKVLIESQAFPTLGVQMMKVGEETGQMEKMLMKVADIYDKEVKNTTQSIVSVLGPIAILTIAVFAFFLMAGVMLAIFSLN
ncbi:MAG: general secretion pathway protein GspF, partial [Gammaproteobacteria bacterium]